MKVGKLYVSKSGNLHVVRVITAKKNVRHLRYHAQRGKKSMAGPVIWSDDKTKKPYRIGVERFKDRFMELRDS